MTEYKLDHHCPFLTVDIVITVGDKVVVIERKNPPLGFAFPGGFVDYGETVETAAKREAKEEVGMDIFGLKLIGVFSNPDRDPRAHIVTIAFLAEAEGVPVAADDAKTAMLVPFYAAAGEMKLIADHHSIAVAAQLLHLGNNQYF